MREHLWQINRLIYSTDYAPHWGWHDDHRDVDRTPEYKPALQQVKAEFAALLKVITGAGLIAGRCLQLGMGECRASHDAWRVPFSSVVTIDGGRCAHNEHDLPGGNTHAATMLRFATAAAPYDFLLIDAGHDFEDVKQDHEDYGPLVRRGGIIAFHDARQRDNFPEIGVPRYIREELVNRHASREWIGSEVGFFCLYVQ